MRTYISLEELCRMVSSKEAALVRYEPRKDGLYPVDVGHPENIADGDVLITNPRKRIMERKAYRMKRQNGGFHLSETFVLFGEEDAADVMRGFGPRGSF